MKKTFKSLITALAVSALFTTHAAAVNEYRGYPDGFDGKGVISSLSKTGICINDVMYTITSKTKFNCPESLNCSRKWFNKNGLVYYVLEKKRGRSEKTIRSLWLVKSLKDQLDRP